MTESNPECNSYEIAEGKCKNRYSWGSAPKSKDYKVADFGQDHDIKDSIKHLDDSEAKLGPWTLPPKEEKLAVSTDIHMRDDPICSSAGCT